MPVAPSIMWCFLDLWMHDIFFQPIKKTDLFTSPSPCGRCAANYKCDVPSGGEKKTHTAEILSLDYAQQRQPLQQCDVMIYFYWGMAKHL